MVITIGAMIGAGKSSLAKLVGEHFGTEVFYESVDDIQFYLFFIQLAMKKYKKKDIHFYFNYGFLIQDSKV